MSFVRATANVLTVAAVALALAAAVVLYPAIQSNAPAPRAYTVLWISALACVALVAALTVVGRRAK